MFGRINKMGDYMCKGARCLVAALAIVVLVTASVNAAPKSGADAIKLVKGWLRLNNRPMNEAMGHQVAKVRTFKNDAGEAAYYVVELLPEGFVLVSADDEITPIIGFAKEGHFIADEKNPLYVLVNRDLPERLKAVKSFRSGGKGKGGGKELTSVQRQKISARINKSKSRWKNLLDSGLSGSPGEAGDILPVYGCGNSEVLVEPLVESKWGQSTIINDSTEYACYNYYTPNGYDEYEYEAIWDPG
ncbi:MAG: Spi family protease inhibitor, partial [Planctomycetes bacterium]|nr:Spi family protease inhibitor [Planctomycetota bacterium]